MGTTIWIDDELEQYIENRKKPGQKPYGVIKNAIGTDTIQKVLDND